MSTSLHCGVALSAKWLISRSLHKNVGKGIGGSSLLPVPRQMFLVKPLKILLRSSSLISEHRWCQYAREWYRDILKWTLECSTLGIGSILNNTVDK